MKLPDKKFSIIYADPPWKYTSTQFRIDKWGKSDTKRGLVPHKSAIDHYKTLDLDEIKAIDVKSISDKDAILFMWATSPLLNQAFEVITAWGFKYKTVGFCWLKMMQHGVPVTNPGYWNLSSIELCLLATKGHPKKVRSDMRQLVVTERGPHSQKPEEVKQRIKLLMGDVPGIELFARNSDDDWETWGNETTKRNPPKGFF